MKKLISVSLTLVLALVLGTAAFAGEGPLPQNAEIPVEAEIGAYAEVAVIKGVDFGVLEGAAALYQAGQPGKFSVESNCDVNIELEMEDLDWITAPYWFKIGDDQFGAASLWMTQAYHVGPVIYLVDGWINIEYISQVEAMKYNTNILVTVSQ